MGNCGEAACARGTCIAMRGGASATSAGRAAASCTERRTATTVARCAASEAHRRPRPSRAGCAAGPVCVAGPMPLDACAHGPGSAASIGTRASARSRPGSESAPRPQAEAMTPATPSADARSPRLRPHAPASRRPTAAAHAPMRSLGFGNLPGGAAAAAADRPPHPRRDDARLMNEIRACGPGGMAAARVVAGWWARLVAMGRALVARRHAIGAALFAALPTEEPASARVST